MKRISVDEQARLLAVLARHDAELRSFKDVHHVDVGFKYVKGKPTQTLAIRIHVKRKTSRAAKKQRLPKDVEGIPTDVLESGAVAPLQGARDGRVEPLVGGVMVRRKSGGFGTLAVVVWEPETQRPLGLSAHHVLVGANGAIGDPIFQPRFQPVGAQHQIGSVVRWHQGLDCAVCTVSLRMLAPGIVDFPRGVRHPKQPLIGMAVAKSGVTTGTTRGLVDGVSSSTFDVVADPEHATIEYVPGESPIADRGDSGALWIEPGTQYAIGLLQGQDPTTGRIRGTQVSRVLSALNVQLTPEGPWRVAMLSHTLYAVEGALDGDVASLSHNVPAPNGDRTVKDFQLVGKRIAVLRGGGLYVFEGPLPAVASSPVELARDVAEFRLRGTRIGIVTQGGFAYAKQGPLDSPWVQLATDAKRIRFGGNRVGVLTTSGDLLVKEGELGSPWTTQLSSDAFAFALERSRIAVLTKSRKLLVKQGALDAPWVEARSNVRDFQLAGSRMALLTRTGVVYGNEGAHDGPWLKLRSGVRSFHLCDETRHRLGVIDTHGFAHVQVGRFDSRWTRVFGPGVEHLILAHDRIAAIVEGRLYVKEGHPRSRRHELSNGSITAVRLVPE